RDVSLRGGGGDTNHVVVVEKIVNSEPDLGSPQVGIAPERGIDKQNGNIEGFDGDRLVIGAIIVVHGADAFVEHSQIPVLYLVSQAYRFGILGSARDPQTSVCVVLAFLVFRRAHGSVQV